MRFEKNRTRQSPDLLTEMSNPQGIDTCIRAYNVLKDHQSQNKVLQFIPVINDELFTVHESEGVIDIGINKRQYLKVFKQAHDYWHLNRDQFLQIDDTYSIEHLNDLYIVTIGYLITTNDHHMIMKVHEQILCQLYKLDDNILQVEFEILTTLISSKMSKINKNSLLWHLLKKVIIILLYHNCMSKELYEVLIMRVFESCKNHFANYYGNFFIRWLFQVNKVMNRTGENEVILENLLSSCHQLLKDVSLWTNLHVLLYDNNLQNTIIDYNLTIQDINEKFSLKIPLISPGETMTHGIENSVALALSEIEWLLAIECTIKTPYMMLLADELKEETVALVTKSLAKQKNDLPQLNSQSLLYSKKLEFIDTLEYIVHRE